MTHVLETVWVWVERSAVVEYVVIGAIALAHLHLLKIFERSIAHKPHKRSRPSTAPRKRKSHV